MTQLRKYLSLFLQFVCIYSQTSEFTYSGIFFLDTDNISESTQLELGNKLYGDIMNLDAGIAQYEYYLNTGCKSPDCALNQLAGTVLTHVFLVELDLTSNTSVEWNGTIKITLFEIKSRSIFNSVKREFSGDKNYLGFQLTEVMYEIMGKDPPLLLLLRSDIRNNSGKLILFATILLISGIYFLGGGGGEHKIGTPPDFPPM